MQELNLSGTGKTARPSCVVFGPRRRFYKTVPVETSSTTERTSDRPFGLSQPRPILREGRISRPVPPNHPLQLSELTVAKARTWAAPPIIGTRILNYRPGNAVEEILSVSPMRAIRRGQNTESFRIRLPHNGAPCARSKAPKPNLPVFVHSRAQVLHNGLRPRCPLRVRLLRSSATAEQANGACRADQSHNYQEKTLYLHGGKPIRVTVAVSHRHRADARRRSCQRSGYSEVPLPLAA